MKPLNALTGLRGIAAYSVLVAHTFTYSFLYSGVNLMQPFAERLAYFGMSLFFVLSGFVIHYNYAKLINSKGYVLGGYQFMVARIARLYPLYALILICTLDGIPSRNFHNTGHAEYTFMLMTQSWFNLQDLTFRPAWSISTEWFFYFAFIFMLPIFNLVKKPIIHLILLLTLTFILLPNLLHWEVKTFGDANVWITYFSPYTRIFDFVAGVLSSMVYLSVKDSQRDINLYEKIGLIVIGCWVFSIMYFDVLSNTKYSILLSNFVYTPAIAPLLIIVCRHNVLDKLLCNRITMFMGEISYSVYLLGFTIMNGLRGTYVSTAPTLMAHINSVIKMGAIITLTTVFAYGGYNLIEKPARRFLRRVLSVKQEQPLLDTAKV